MSLSSEQGTRAIRISSRTAVLASIALVNLASGIAVQLLLLARYGAGEATDAFFAASTVPQLVIAILVGAAVNVIVPMFAGRTDKDADGDAWTLLSWSAVILVLIAAVIGGLAWPITTTFVPGLSSDAKALAAGLTIINAIALPLAGLASVSAAVHQGHGRFVAPELIAATTNLALLLAVVWALAAGGGLILIAWMMAARLAVQVLMLFPGLGRPRLSLGRTTAVDDLVKGMRPLLFSTSYFKLAPLIDRWLASFGLAGDISLLQILQQMFAAAASIASKSVVGPLTAFLATQRKQQVSVADRGSGYLRLQRLTGIVCTAGYAAALTLAYVLAPRFLPEAQAHRLVILIVALAGLYTAGFLGQIAAGWFYAEGDTATPARVGAIGFTIGLVARAVFFPMLGTVGIAIALSVNQAVNWAMMYRKILRDTARP